MKNALSKMPAYGIFSWKQKCISNGNIGVVEELSHINPKLKSPQTISLAREMRPSPGYVYTLGQREKCLSGE